MGEERDAAREAALAALLDAAVGAGLDAWSTAPGPTSDPAYDDALRVLGAALSQDWTTALDLHRTLPPPAPRDRTAVRLRAGAGCWAASGDASPSSAEVLREAVGALPEDGALDRFATYLLVEGALAHARLDLATALAAEAGERLWEAPVLLGRPHPFGLVMGVCRARLLLFAGRVAEAEAVVGVLAPQDAPVLGALVAGTEALVRGNLADAVGVRRLAAEVDVLAPCPRDHLTVGAHLLAAFGQVAVGDVTGAAKRVLLAGADAGLSELDVVDRALGLELLVALAVAEDDLDSAQAWRDRALGLLASPIADSTVLRLLARVELLAGDAAAAQVLAERAVARAVEAGRGIEEVEATILLNRARLQDPGPGARAEAVKALARMAQDAATRGHAAARRSASRELRPLGLRLPPLAGSGWSGLTEREAEVARWVAEGASNREVAERLVVSEHTVRAHVSRVLAAFGVATRSALPAALGEPTRDGPARPALTARQSEVAALVARGHGNREIAAELGLSVRTVERHVGDILQRWSLSGRTSLARAVVAGAADAAAASTVDPALPGVSS